MTAQTGTYVQQLADGSGASARGARLAQAGLLAKNADGTVRVGVLADGQGPVVTGNAGMSYTIRKHVAVTKTSEANGPTLVPNDGNVTVTTDPAPAANSRIDIVWVQQRHLAVDGGADTVNTPLFGVAVGEPGAAPGAPTNLLPTGALELARTTVTAGTVATSGLVFIQAPWTVATGGTLPGPDGVVGGSWSTWSASPAGFGAGVGFTGKFEQVGKTVRARFKVTTSANGITALATIPLPVAPNTDYATSDIAIGQCVMVDASFSPASASRTAGTIMVTGTSMFFIADRAGSAANVDSDTPWVWANGDTIGGTIVYEAA